MTINLLAIVESDIDDAIHMDNVDDACALLQEIAGITDGGVAALAFSGFDWECAHYEREAQIRAWLKLEQHYAGDR